jgi:hypothetical protein
MLTGGGKSMFGKQDGQGQPFGDMSNVSLPGQFSGGPQQNSQFATPTPPSVPPVQDLSVPEIPAHTDQSWGTPAPQAGPTDTSDLATLKQQALSQLTPLVGHLDQTPEEKFRTTMMMIQAADDESLIKEAYDAAQAIQDEKVRAQALLDVINEINYFSQKHQQ